MRTSRGGRPSLIVTGSVEELLLVAAAWLLPTLSMVAVACLVLFFDDMVVAVFFVCVITLSLLPVQPGITKGGE